MHVWLRVYKLSKRLLYMVLLTLALALLTLSLLACQSIPMDVMIIK